MRLTLIAMAVLAVGPARAEPPKIVVDTPVTASLVQQVLGESGTAGVLLPRGASPHHHQMRPSDAQALQQAGLLVWTGPALTPWLDRAAASLGEGTAQLRLLDVPGTRLRAFGGDAEGAGAEEAGTAPDDHGESHDHDHAHDYHDGHDPDDDDAHDDGHDHGGGTDPHAWLDPQNAQTWLAAIAEALGRADPEGAERYALNARDAAQRIADLDAALQARLAAHRDARFVVLHDAYGYFTDHFGLEPALPVSLGDASTPSAARLSALRDEITATGAVCAFPETGSDARLLESVIDGTPLRLGAALSPEGAGLEPGPDLYQDLLGGLAGAIETCLDHP